MCALFHFFGVLGEQTRNLCCQTELTNANSTSLKILKLTVLGKNICALPVRKLHAGSRRGQAACICL